VKVIWKNILPVSGTGFFTSVANGLMSVAALVPQSMKHSGMQGLYGNYNGVTTDDLTLRTGEQLPITATEEEIYYYFGLSCTYCNCDCHCHYNYNP